MSAKIKKISIGFKNAKGTINIDDISLEKTDLSNPENLVSNGNFDNNLTSWQSKNVTSGDGIKEENGNKYVKIIGDPNTYKSYEQIINVSGKAGDVFNVAGWVLNTGVFRQNNTKIMFELFDENNVIVHSEAIYINPDNTSWQFVNKNMKAPKDYKKAKILIGHLYQRGYALFDNIGVYKNENATNFNYDVEGNVVDTKDKASQNNKYVYTASNELFSSTTPKNRSTLYEYDHNHKNRLLRTFFPDGMETSYTYDNYGNVTNENTFEKKSVTLRNIDPNKSYYLKTISNDLYLSASGKEEDANPLKLKSKEEGTKFFFKRDKEGLYEIATATTQIPKAVDIYNAKQDNGTLVNVTPKNDNNAQRFKLFENSDGTYTFKTKVTNFSKCIDIANGVITLNNNIQQYTCNSTNAQKFILEETHDIDFEEVESINAIDSEKVYYLKSSASDLYIQPSSTDIKNGVGLVLNKINENAEWKIKEPSPGNFQFELANHPNFIFDVKGGATANSTPIQIWTKNGNEHLNQTFEIFQNEDGSFTFRPKVTNYNKCVEVYNGRFNENQKIQHYDCNYTTAQRFVILEKNNNGRKYTETKSEYSSNGDFKLKDINEREKATNYTYNEGTGTVSKITDSKGNETNYTYDVIDRVTSINNGDTTNNYTYNHDKLSKIDHNGFAYNFTYDNFGNTSSVKVNDKLLITNEYEANNGNLLSSTYGNNNKVSYSYDKFDRIINKNSITNNINYFYNDRGEIARTENNFNYKNFSYDLSGRLIKEDNNGVFNTNYSYNKYNELEKVNYKFGAYDKTLKYSYDLDGKIIKNDNIKYTYDKLNRTSKKNIDDYLIKYNYLNINDLKTSHLISSVTNGENKIFYTYDDNSNIASIAENNVLINEYEYDHLNQLIKEHDKKQNKTIVYTYDSGGNILSKKYYNYKTETLVKEINYNYNNTWKDQLTSYDNKNISYDAIGNPLTYDNYSYTWQNGRELASIKKDNQTINYVYDENGIRTEKKIGNKSYKYYLNGKDIIFEETPDGTIYYKYDKDGIIGFEYDNKNYYYEKNAQSDIIGLLDENFNKIATYTYDAWGKVISVKDNDNNEITAENDIANINPFRYRSYYYDQETSLYYLNTRYYNPDWGRFINADGILGANEDEISYNLYAYTSNNPVTMMDKDGEFVQFVIALLGAWGAYDIYTAIKNPTAENIFIASLSMIPAGKMTVGAKGVYEGTAKIVAKNTTKKITTKKWKVGDPITKPTVNGYPSWATVRSRYWKNEAFYNSDNGKYAYPDLERMKKGLAPLVWDESFLKDMPLELHHINGRKVPDSHNITNLSPLTPTEHAEVDFYRKNFMPKR